MALAFPRAIRIGLRVKLLAGVRGHALFTGVLGWYSATRMERLNDGTRIMSVDVFGGTYLLATWLDRAWESRSDLLPYPVAETPPNASGSAPRWLHWTPTWPILRGVWMKPTRIGKMWKRSLASTAPGKATTIGGIGT
jgi:hypothetical protein